MLQKGVCFRTLFKIRASGKKKSKIKVETIYKCCMLHMYVSMNIILTQE